MQDMDIRALALQLACAIDQRFFNSDVNVARRQLNQRSITLAGCSHRVGKKEIEAALRDMTSGMPEAANIWLEERLAGFHDPTELIDIFWNLSVVTIPHKYRQPRFYANLAMYRALVSALFDRFLWSLAEPGSGAAAVTQRQTYQSIVRSFHAQLMAHFDRRRGRPPSYGPQDHLIDLAFEEAFGEGKDDVHGASLARLEQAPHVVPRPVQASRHSPTPQPATEPRGKKPIPVPVAPVTPTETLETLNGDIEWLRGQIAMLNRTLQFKLQQARGLLFRCDEAATCPNWSRLMDSPWHLTELSWHMSLVPRDQAPQALREIAHALTLEKKLPSIPRFRRILENVTKRFSQQ